MARVKIEALQLAGWLKRAEAEIEIQRKIIDLLKLENEALRSALERISEGRHE